MNTRAQPAAPHKYSMTVDLSVLEALGINLYSNAAAVLSELVANAWDADATKISITWSADNTQVIVSDNGCGMSSQELNSRFLTVGYQKRTVEGATSTKWLRPFMGRKGIGKLSVFSIADVVEVYSVKRTEVSGLRIVVADLRDAIVSHAKYHPAEVPVPDDYATKGTTIVLSHLKSHRSGLTAAALRKRLARRFDVVDTKPANKGGFAIYVNGNRLTYEDRQELKKLEFIWEFGQQTLDAKALPKDIGRYVFSTDVVDAAKNWKVSGWIGTAKTPSELADDDDAGSLKNIIVLARKRPIQEGIIEKLDFSRLFGNYVTGQIQADFLDLDDHDDIATSDRQRLIEDDPRVVALQNFLRARFLEASETWAKARPKRAAVDALDKYPALKKWVADRPGWQQESARKMIGTIATIELEGPKKGEDRVSLFRSGILGFERLALREATDQLEQLTSMNAVDLLPLFATQDNYEAALYTDILRSRLQAVSQLRNLSSTDEKEKVLQQHLYNHLWLLDASWERAIGSEQMEQDLRRIEPGLFAANKDGETITGRIDIRYASAGGKHLIFELKRYSVKVDIHVLAEQGNKYAVALRDLLIKQGTPDPQIEVIFVLGEPPKAKDAGLLPEADYIRQRLESCNGRIVYYDQLIHNAEQQYADYLAASGKAKELDDLLTSLTTASSPDTPAATAAAQPKPTPSKRAATPARAAATRTGTSHGKAKGTSKR